MAVLTWPAELPCGAIFEGYSRGFGDGRLRTAVDAGPARVRRKFSAVVRPVTLTILVDADQLARFGRFWDEETGGGVLPFLYRDINRDSRVLATADGLTLTDEMGRPLAVSAYDLVRFGESAPSAPERIGASRWRLTFGLEVLP